MATLAENSLSKNSLSKNSLAQNAESHSSGIGPAPRLFGVYRKRPLRFIRHEQLGDWRLKVYGIATPGRAARPELVEATLEQARKVLPPIDDDRPGIGFVIAHDAATVSIGLVYWWQSANELHQRVHTGPLDDPRALSPVADPAAGCVWELGIIDFERRAWIEDVLKGHDIELYMTRRLDADV
ncbi:hypothetical protein SAMN05519104_2850 [Rhizobiales bacterium GAS188]|nr:hypothetical protein SAMN05519104_2850 [Rhizobiales bacterium GAS188]